MTNRITEDVFELFSVHPAAAILMSGQGTNAEAILGNEEVRDLYDIRVIVTDNPDSNAGRIADDHSLQLVTEPVKRFVDRTERQSYFNNLGSILVIKGIEAVIYAGYMKIVSPDFCTAFPGVNVHPADLTIKGADGRAKYRGMRALPDMRNDLGYVRSTVHVVDNPVDSGSAIALSKPVSVESTISDHDVHALLKEKEHSVYARTLLLLGKGALSIDSVPYEATDLERIYHDR